MSRLLGPIPSLPERDCLELPGYSIEYCIRASARRRTLALRLDTGGVLTVSAPATLSLARIREFVASHRDWIESKRARLASCSRAPLVLETGTPLPYLGTMLELEVVTHSTTRCRQAMHRLVVQVSDHHAVRRALEAWYRRAAARHFAERVTHFAARVGRAPSSIAVRAQRTRWGSCSQRGIVSLNWRLMQASAEVVDYVIVHELCHLLVPDHSPRFWTEVTRVLPDWRERRRALRAFGRTLQF